MHAPSENDLRLALHRSSLGPYRAFPFALGQDTDFASTGTSLHYMGASVSQVQGVADFHTIDIMDPSREHVKAKRK